MIGRIHLPLFLLAFTIAFVIKVAVHQARQISETTVAAQVRYEKEDKAVVILDPVQEVKVRVRGPRNEIAALNPFTVDAEVSLKQGEQGAVVITEDRIKVKFRTPGDFDVVSIEPNRFTLTLEPEERRLLPVRADLTGEPAAGAFAETPEVRPARVDVVGPRSVVRSLTELVATVSLEGHALTFEASVVIVPPPLVKIEPRQVVVYVPMKLPGPEGSVFSGPPPRSLE